MKVEEEEIENCEKFQATASLSIIKYRETIFFITFSGPIGNLKFRGDMERVQ